MHACPAHLQVDPKRRKDKATQSDDQNSENPDNILKFDQNVMKLSNKIVTHA